MQATGDLSFDTRAEALAWLEANGIAHVARYNVEIVAPFVDEADWPALRHVGARRRLVDLMSREGVERSREWLAQSPLGESLPAIVARFLAHERDEAAAARAIAHERLTPPVDPRAAEVHRRLLTLRESVPPSVAPRRVPTHGPKALRADPELPGFRFEDLFAFEPFRPMKGGFVRPRVTLSLSESAPRAECDACGSGCVHVLAAIDAAMLWLAAPSTKAFEKALDALARPGWQRVLKDLDDALEKPRDDHGRIEVSWRLRVAPRRGVEVEPWVRKVGSSGQRLPTKPIAPRRLLLEYGDVLDAEDSRIATLLAGDGTFASRAVLDALASHPRVWDETPDKSVRIERALVGIVAEERTAGVRITVGVDGAALPADEAERLRTMKPTDVAFLWDWQGGTRRLTLLDCGAELRAMLEVLAKQGDLFPPESHAELLASLSKWATHMPVAMPRSIRGERVLAKTTFVLRVTAQTNGTVHVALRIRPLDDAPSVVPGGGARDAYVRRGEKTFHAVRDLKLEVDAANALCVSLPFGDPEALDEPFEFRFERAADALVLLGACKLLPEPPELEWVGKPIRSVASGGPEALRVSVRKKRGWFGMLGDLNVSGERVELARLLDAARKQERYVALEAHTYLEMDDALREHLAHLGEHVRTARSGLEIGVSAAEALRALERAGAAVETDLDWQDFETRAKAAEALDPVLPAELRAELRSYQLDGFRWLSRLAVQGAGGVLADDMGLGKTVQALALLLSRASRGPALVLAPTSVAFNWKDEAEKFAPSLRFKVYADESDREAALETLGPGDVLVLSYGLLVRDVERLAKIRFATVVFDEAQALKNAGTQRFRAAKVLDAEFKIALSGTPIENHLGELWSLYAIVFPQLFGSWEAFRDRFAAPIEKHWDPDAPALLAKLLRPFLLRRTKTEVESELPSRTEVRVPVVLSPAEWQLYEDARLAALSDLESSRATMREQERRVQVLASLTRLRLAACHPRLYDDRTTLPSTKLARLLALVDELRAEGQRALVFSQFTSHLALVREALGERRIAYEYLDGSTPQKLRRTVVESFQQGSAPLFLISLKAGGFGLNLTAATNVIHLDPWWNPATEDQASDRAHRLGQTKPVTIYRLVSRGTIEERMLMLHEEKRALALGVLEGTSEGVPMSVEELVELLA